MPTPVVYFEEFTALSLGGKHICGRRADGTVGCWGDNVYRQLGTSVYPSSLTPVTPPGLMHIVEIATGLLHSCARRSDGMVSCWGSGVFRKVDDSPEQEPESIDEPTEVPGLTGAVQIAAGGGHSCARLEDATVRCWGRNDGGQLGTTTADEEPVTVAVPGVSDVASLALGADHSCALHADGTVSCWGSNALGQVGIGIVSPVAAPTKIKGLTEVVQLALGYQSSCALRASGELRCWGRNDHGQQGDGTQSPSATNSVPMPVPGVTDVVRVAVGVWHVCALRQDGSVRCWGANAHGQLGDGTLTDRLSPTPVFW